MIFCVVGLPLYRLKFLKAVCCVIDADFHPNSWPGVAVFLQNALIFFAYV